jgi:hypothetical protein
MNGDDIKIAADMARWGWTDSGWNQIKSGGLKHLDISEVQIVSGGTFITVAELTGALTETRPFNTMVDLSVVTGIAEDNVIGNMMFICCDQLKTIKLPKTITKIGKYAFSLSWVLEEIVIPASVTSIGEKAFWQSFNTDLVDAYTSDPVSDKLPYTTVRLENPTEDMDNAIVLEENALVLGPEMTRSGHTFTPIVHLFSPTYQLDDFACNSQLENSLKAGQVKAVATPPNKYWTFSNGVDVIVPDNVKVYTCQIVNGETDIRELTDALVVDGKRTIKRNNGVLVACPDDATSNAYELVAKYNADLVGTTPATTNANDYPNNSLVPVLTKSHYEPGEYYMLYHGKWVAMASDATKVPACKALLKK